MRNPQHKIIIGKWLILGVVMLTVQVLLGGITQKVITTTGTNVADKTISIRRCSEPSEQLKNIYTILKQPAKPFTKIKSVVHKCELKKNKPQQNQIIAPT